MSSSTKEVDDLIRGVKPEPRVKPEPKSPEPPEEESYDDIDDEKLADNTQDRVNSALALVRGGGSSSYPERRTNAAMALVRGETLSSMPSSSSPEWNRIHSVPSSSSPAWGRSSGDTLAPSRATESASVREARALLTRSPLDAEPIRRATDPPKWHTITSAMLKSETGIVSAPAPQYPGLGAGPAPRPRIPRRPNSNTGRGLASGLVTQEPSKRPPVTDLPDLEEGEIQEGPTQFEVVQAHKQKRQKKPLVVPVASAPAGRARLSQRPSTALVPVPVVGPAPPVAIVPLAPAPAVHAAANAINAFAAPNGRQGRAVVIKAPRKGRLGDRHFTRGSGEYEEDGFVETLPDEPKYKPRLNSRFKRG
jgi:hypothetical protein